MVILQDGRKILLNEEQVCSIEPKERGMAQLRMSNGDTWLVQNPPYQEWENDLIRRND